MARQYRFWIAGSGVVTGLALAVSVSCGHGMSTAPPNPYLAASQPTNRELANTGLEAKVNALLARMTLEEKVGQLVQVSAGVPAGPGTGLQDYDTMIAEGEVGSMLNEGSAHTTFDAKRTNAYQQIAVEKSRLHIPLLFGLDVIHGYRTIFPVPLGLASSSILASSRFVGCEAAK